jgi:hypothetical protein
MHHSVSKTGNKLTSKTFHEGNSRDNQFEFSYFTIDNIHTKKSEYTY